MQKAGALEIARVPAIYVFPTVKDGILSPTAALLPQLCSIPLQTKTAGFMAGSVRSF